ncbi:hypothetical protein [Geodermatophilus sp. SYSU D00684]
MDLRRGRVRRGPGGGHTAGRTRRRAVPAVSGQVHGSYDVAWRDLGPCCPSSAELPADGNGMGVVISLAAAGAVGGTSVVLSRRRRDRGTPAPTAG